ncbi:hypothetical protein [Noviherbaspirillum sp. UKPF54]|uniref:hypothetical protein n=1 Tax=Noviherbaspirillum sp. UKPF54 TaxID=2601898 RepID=UPI0011B1AA22|nr:hypothetical protein [Noviherbaspirillum sp. UKPF54]QDZ26597.1 hypothetical protein FAY22_00600 [Noviherbaspirillum sp. UKPF54]
MSVQFSTSHNPTFKFRAECFADTQAIRAVFLPWIMEWKETRSNIDLDGVIHAMPDVDVEFSVVSDGPTLGEMRWLIDGISNCHVAAETIETSENYTGERNSRQAFAAPASRPRDEILRQALGTVKTRRQVLNLELERTLQTHRTYDTASRLGNKWQPFHSDESNPGWLVPVPHEPTGMTALRRISAPIGCKNWQKLGQQLVSARISTIEA